MPSLALARAANAAYSFPTRPVAIFLGGTSGVGQAAAQAFARYTKGNAHIIICGRNRAAAESTIASFPKPSSSGSGSGAQHEFVECDASMIKNIDATTSALRARLTKVNYLVVSPGFMSFRGRDETSEGIDRKLAVHYYGRWKFINDLLPLVRSAKEAEEDAKVMSILAPGDGGKVDLDDLGLKKTFSVTNAALTAVTYTDLMIDSFAEKEPGVSFIHIHPGVVLTNLFHPVVKVLFSPFAKSQEDCGEHLLYALLHAEAGPQRRNSKGDDMGMKGYCGTDEARTKVWEHTVATIQHALDPQA